LVPNNRDKKGRGSKVPLQGGIIVFPRWPVETFMDERELLSRKSSLKRGHSGAKEEAGHMKSNEKGGS